MQGSHMRRVGSRSWAQVAARLVLPVALVLLGACVAQAPVVQGRVVSLEAGQLRMQDESRPGAEPLVVDITRAEVGARPVAGDLVRVAYREEGGVRRALAVMNLTRQERAEGRRH
jgi:hypothetical protein